MTSLFDQAAPKFEAGPFGVAFSVYGLPREMFRWLNQGPYRKEILEDDRPLVELVREVAEKVMEGTAPLEGPLMLVATFQVPRSKWHLSNPRQAPRYPFVRPGLFPDAVQDTLRGMNGLVWKDPAQLVDALFRRRFLDPPRLDVQVRPAL